MNADRVYLTFSTDRQTSELLTMIAHGCKMTQPELIEEICKNFIEDLNKAAEEKLKELQNNNAQAIT